jgi:phosphoglycerol transferase MdoB-like AlkP superfamily enzyme
MKDKFLFFIKYVAFWIVLQFFFRLVFISIYGLLGKDMGFREIMLAFIYGLKYDLLLTCYILIIPALAIVVFTLFNSGFFKKIIFVYSAFILAVIIVLYITNLVVYRFWNYPIDKSIFDYLGSPREWLANTKTIQSILTLAICLSLYLFFWLVIFKKWLANRIKILKPGWSSVIFLIIPFLFLINPIQGKADVRPSKKLSDYFQDNELLTHTATNPILNLCNSISEIDKMGEKFSFISQDEAESAHRYLDPDNRPVPSVLNNPRPNIVIIMMESFASDIIAESGANPGITPEFNRLVEEGIFFSNFYATGTMTDRGLAGIISGYPALPGDCIVLHKRKIDSIPYLSNDLKAAGYSTSFLYGGDVNFANMKSYLLTGNFERIISDNNDNFSSSINRSKWGVPDEFVYERLFNECSHLKDPFFILCMTLSNHNPFDVPMDPVFPGNSYLDLFYNSSYYADKCLGEFISKAKSTDWYTNTLFIMVADHGTRIENENEYDLKRFKIPMLWLGGALSIDSLKITQYGSQTDIPKTLLGQLNLPADHYDFGKNLLDPSSPSFAFYCYQNGFGMISENYHLVFHMPASEFWVEKGPESNLWKEKCLGYMQYLASDYIKR